MSSTRHRPTACTNLQDHGRARGVDSGGRSDTTREIRGKMTHTRPLKGVTPLVRDRVPRLGRHIEAGVSRRGPC